MNASSSSARPGRRTAREKALAAALELFNEKGTAAVSTNHIAERAGISPGNLYYWFDSKRAIVEALFDAWSEASSPVAPADHSPAALLVALFATIDANDRRAFEYRGIARELLMLVHSDPALRERYQTIYRERSALLRGLASVIIDAGLMIAPPAPSSIDDIVTAAWILNEFTPVFLQQLDPTVGEAASAAGSRALLRAFLTPEGQRVLADAGSETDR